MLSNEAELEEVTFGAMVNMGFLAVDDAYGNSMANDQEREFRQLFLTFVVGTSDGCNLKCGFCFVRQRVETTTTFLLPNHYAKFIRDIAAVRHPYALAIQGHEPLLPSVRPHTQAILATGRHLGLPTGLVTNGTYLADAADWLAILSPTSLAVSLDADNAWDHDRLRGVSGTWQAAIDGIAQARKALSSRTKLSVASMLMPESGKKLQFMPYLLAENGVLDWIISPLHKVGANKPGGPVMQRNALYDDVIRLQDASDKAGVRLVIDDELGCLQHEHAVAKRPELRRLHVRSLSNELILLRLSTGGECSVQNDILRQVTPETPRWHPDEHAGVFLKRVLADVT